MQKISRRRPRFDTELGHFTLLFLQRTAKKCTKRYNARAQLLFCSLDLLFNDVLVAVVVVNITLCDDATEARQMFPSVHVSCDSIT